MQGQASDIAIQAQQLAFIKRLMAERIAFHTGQTAEEATDDQQRDQGTFHVFLRGLFRRR